MDSTTLRLMMGAAGAANPAYVEDVFSTYLYTGNGSTQTITNGIDLSGKGGLVWLKGRSNAADHVLHDTVRGNTKILNTNSTAAQDTASAGTNITSFNSNGFSLGTNYSNINTNGQTYCSWTFRKAPKFFDVVTYTGNGTAGRTIAHNLGSTPGFIITKRTDAATNWLCYHRSLGFGNATDSDTNYIVLNSTSGLNAFGTAGVIVAANATTFTPGASANFSGGTYVAYVFAHDAGGFGDSGNDSVVNCGSYTGNGTTSGPTVTLGWEPQWLLVKNATSADNNWVLIDNMRGFSVTGNQWLYPNASAAEGTTGLPVAPLATGFQPRNSGTFVNESGSTYIYIAIRRGPMKTPTVGTSVFNTQTGTYSSLATLTAADMVIFKGTSSNGQTAGQVTDRLRGFGPFSDWTTAATSTSPFLSPSSSAAESTSNSYTGTEPIGQNVFGNKNAPVSVSYGSPNSGSASAVNYSFRRAPGFFDVVAYAGSRSAFDGGSTAIRHNLGVTPELMIIKSRTSGSYGWSIYSTPTGNTDWLSFDAFGPSPNSNFWNNTSPTASNFTVGSSTYVNVTGQNYIAYLFASCPGVSKIGSYTGTGTTQQVNCGFTAGARFILIKRVDGASGSNWYVYDTARGIVSGNDPYLWLNTADAEVTSTDYIDPLNSGFEISSSAPAAINANGGSFIFLAVA